MSKIADGECFAILDPPKPEPVLREAWIALYADGCASGFNKTKTGCENLTLRQEGEEVMTQHDDPAWLRHMGRMFLRFAKAAKNDAERDNCTRLSDEFRALAAIKEKK